MPLDCVDDERKMDTRFTVVPWYNVDQFTKVYHYAYSSDIVKKRWAYDTMSVWDTRCYPSLPAAIECTYALVGAVIQDILWNSQKSIVNYGDMQCIYGSAITRFVSLMVETHKDQSNQSTAEIAKRLGIPPFIAHLRNDWCHCSRPSLAMLRLAAEDSLRYLEETYWKKQVDQIKNHIKWPEEGLQTQRLLFNFIHHQFSRLCKKTKNTESKKEQRLCAENVLKLKELIRRDKRKFIKVLLLDGFFIPLDEDLKMLMNLKESKLWQIASDEKNEKEKDDVNDNSSAGSVFDDSKELYLPCIPKIHELIWAPIIATLNVYDAVPIFIESLLKSQNDRTPDGQKLLIAWVLKILRIHTAGGCVEKSYLRLIFRKKALVANWRSMFYAAIIKPCKYTVYILPLILCHLDLEHEVTLRVTSLLAIFLGEFKDLKQRILKVHTFEEFKITDVRQRAEIIKQRQEETPEGSIWSRYLDEDYMNWPVGYVINVEKEKEDEEEDSDEDILECMMEEEESDMQSDMHVSSNENGVTKECEMDVDSIKLPGLPEFDEIKSVMINRRRGSFLYKK